MDVVDAEINFKNKMFRKPRVQQIAKKTQNNKMIFPVS